MDRIKPLKGGRSGLNVSRPLQQGFAQCCRSKGIKIQDAADALLAWWLSLKWAERVKIQDAGLAELERMGLIEPDLRNLASTDRLPDETPAPSATVANIKGSRVSTKRKV